MQQIYKILIFIGLWTMLFSLQAEAQTTLRGKVLDEVTGEALIGATVAVVEGGSGGATTNYDGEFSVKVDNLPAKLSITYTGYAAKEVVFNSADNRPTVRLGSSDIIIEEAIVRGQRVDDKQKAAPLTVENLDAIAIRETAAVSFYNGLGNLKGVDLTTASLGFTIINTRGFNSTSPVRSLQIIDGVDNQAPGLNFSLGNFLGASDL
ncbi:MAG: carboxypeptidase-like regulatory domain-containing protein, partial [Saprospiraceae bacterium]